MWQHFHKRVVALQLSQWLATVRDGRLHEVVRSLHKATTLHPWQWMAPLLVRFLARLLNPTASQHRVVCIIVGCTPTEQHATRAIHALRNASIRQSIVQ